MAKLTIVIGSNRAGKFTRCRQHRDRWPENFHSADLIAKDSVTATAPANGARFVQPQQNAA